MSETTHDDAAAGDVPDVARDAVKAGAPAAGAPEAGAPEAGAPAGPAGGAPGVAPERQPLDATLVRELLRQPHGCVARVEVLGEVGSTNTYLVDAARTAPHAWPLPSVVVADHQTAGRGRLERAWQTPPHTALTSSMLIAPGTPRETWGWLPLLAGLAAARALRATTGVPVVAKWPNDLLVPAPDGHDMLGWGPFRKVGGILTEVVDAERVVVGLGVNVLQTQDELPVPSASSLWLAGAAVSREVLLTALEDSVIDVLGQWREHDGDAVAAGLSAEVEGCLVTVGAQVRALVAGGREVRGTALGLGPDGSLRVSGADGTVTDVVSGDVQHMRMVVPA